MTARYLVRFDDICPTMNWRVWERIERVLVKHDVRPILAVVPDNRDSKLRVAPPDDDFWSHVRGWQARGWSIGLHGYQHAYETKDSGILGLNPRSEFAGLPLDVQLRKLRLGIERFEREGVRVDAWVAPGHSFDATTLRALRELGIRTVSDGFFPRVVRDEHGMVWVPQQLWRFRSMPFGVWTVCCHLNSWSDAQIARFERDVEEYTGRLVGLDEVLTGSVAPLSAVDRLFARFWRTAVLARRSAAA